MFLTATREWKVGECTIRLYQNLQIGAMVYYVEKARSKYLPILQQFVRCESVLYLQEPTRIRATLDGKGVDVLIDPAKFDLVIDGKDEQEFRVKLNGKYLRI